MDNSELPESDFKDLFSNAIRRFKEGKFDDCVARLYRLVEMVAQIEFKKEFNKNSEKVDLEFLPDELKKRIAENQQNE